MCIQHTLVLSWFGSASPDQDQDAITGHLTCSYLVMCRRELLPRALGQLCHGFIKKALLLAIFPLYNPSHIRTFGHRTNPRRKLGYTLDVH